MTTTRSISFVLAPVFVALDTWLAIWNWYLRPDRGVAWAVTLALLGVMTAALYMASRRSTHDASDRGIADGVLFAGLMLAISLGARLVATGGVDRDFSQRAVMVMLGLFLAFTGNGIPKTLTPLSAARCDAARAQACRRFAGWTWVLTGLAFAGVWIALPVDLATPASMALVVSAVSATLAQIVRVRRLPPRAA